MGREDLRKKEEKGRGIRFWEGRGSIMLRGKLFQLQVERRALCGGTLVKVDMSKRASCSPLKAYEASQQHWQA